MVLEFPTHRSTADSPFHMRLRDGRMYIIYWESLNVLLRCIFKMTSVHTKVMYMNEHSA